MSVRNRAELTVLAGLSAGALTLDAMERQAGVASWHELPGLYWGIGLLGGALLALFCKGLLARLVSRADPYGEEP